MSRKVFLEPEASSELHEVARWYEYRGSGVGLAASTSVLSVERLAAPIGNIGVQALVQMRKIFADLLDLCRPARHP